MHVRPLLTAAVLAVAVLLSPGRADAQQADTLRASTALWTACPGATVRIGVAGDSLTGRCGTVADGRLVVRTAGAERQVQLTDVRSIEVRRSRMAETAVFLGFAGAAVGAYVRDPAPCYEDLCPSTREAGVRGGGAALGALVGAAAGVVLGSRIRYWQARYP